MNKYYWMGIFTAILAMETLISLISFDKVWCDCWLNCFIGWNELLFAPISLIAVIALINYLFKKGEEESNKKSHE